MSDRKFYLDSRAEAIIARLVSENIPDDKLLNTRDLAALLSVSEQWCEIVRHRGEGPRWTALSKRCIRYRMADVIAWLKTRARTSTKHGAGKAA